jgi:hypothetical protein
MIGLLISNAPISATFLASVGLAKARSAVPTRSFNEANHQIAAAVGERKRIEKRSTFDLGPSIAGHQSFPKRFGGQGASRLCPPYARLLEVVVIADVLRITDKPEARMMAAMIARGEVLTKHARHLMHITMHHVVSNLIDPRRGNLVTRLVQNTLDFFDSGHSGLL